MPEPQKDMRNQTKVRLSLADKLKKHNKIANVFNINIPRLASINIRAVQSQD